MLITPESSNHLYCTLREVEGTTSGEASGTHSRATTDPADREVLMPGKLEHGAHGGGSALIVNECDCDSAVHECIDWNADELKDWVVAYIFTYCHVRLKKH